MSNDNIPKDSKPRVLTAVPELPEFYKPRDTQAERLEYVESRFSAIPGQPSIIFFEQETDTVVSICPVPQVGLVITMPDTLNYVAVAHRIGGEFNKEQAAQYIERAANMIDFGELVAPEVEQSTFQLALDPAGVTNDTGTGYRAILCVNVPSSIFQQNLNLAIMQGNAAQRIADSIYSQAMPGSQSTATH